uniref:Uncharacterized protein n=1 Tax=Glossina pallidipes TaxID=7398 RepID=A0A1B0A9S4_GLOPL
MNIFLTHILRRRPFRFIAKRTIFFFNAFFSEHIFRLACLVGPHAVNTIGFDIPSVKLNTASCGTVNGQNTKFPYEEPERRNEQNWLTMHLIVRLTMPGVGQKPVGTRLWSSGFVK